MDYVFSKAFLIELVISSLLIYKIPYTSIILTIIIAKDYINRKVKGNYSTKLNLSKRHMKACVYGCNETFKVKNNFNIQKFLKNEVFIEVKAAAINPVDYKVITAKIPFIRWFFEPTVGRDFSGIVIDIGANVTNFKIGDEVFGNAAGGSLQEYTYVRESEIALKPKNISFEEAASIGLAGGTSLQALRHFGDLNGKKVLIIGGSGGCGSLGVQIAKYYNAKVYAVCGPKNVEYVKSIGADVILDYTKADYLKIIENEKFDLIYDTVSSKDDPDQEVIFRKYLKENGIGKYVAINGHVGDFTKTILRTLTGINIERKDYHITLLNWNTDDLNTLSTMLEEGKLKSKYQTFSLSQEEVVTAFDLLQSRRTVGKLVFAINANA